MLSHANLRPYQRRMIDHVIEHPRCALWAGMGLGKTVAVLTAVDALLLAGDIKRVLVLAPLRVARSTWPLEPARWSHLRHLEIGVIHGSAQSRQQAIRRDRAIYAMNYENAPWLVEQWGARWPYDMVIADESTRLKGFRLNRGTQRARALGRVAHTCTRRWVNLTGTPSPNGLIDLYGQAWFTDRGIRLGRTFTAFKERWFAPSFNGYGLEPLPTAQEQIQDRLADICLSLKAEDHLTLPKLIENEIRVELPAKARALYREFEREMFISIAGQGIEAFNAAARTNKCLQLANGAAYHDEKGNWSEVHTAKIKALESVIEESAGAPVLVAYHFRSDLARLQKAFPQARALDQSPATLTDWNAGRIPILLAHPASAGHGLNLQDGGHILVFFGLNWNLEEHQQIIERIGPTRQAQAGHDRPVFVHYLIGANTVDEVVLRRLKTKASVQELLLEAMSTQERTACGES